MNNLATFCPVLLVSFVVISSPAHACLCEPSSAEKRFANADLVVVGRAYETLANRSEAFVEPDRPETWYARAYRFSVLETKKAPSGLTIESGITVLDHVACSSNIGLGELFVLYARKRKNGTYFLTDSCSGTERLHEDANEASIKCSHPHSAKQSISQADAVFAGFVVSGETDARFESHVYHYRVLVKDVWKNSQVGQVVDVLWQQTSGSQLHVTSGYQFFVRKKNNQYFHDVCLEVEPLPKPQNFEERSRAAVRIEGEFEQLRLDHLPDNGNIPAAEYASTKTGQLTSEAFSSLASPRTVPDGDAGTVGVEHHANPVVGVPSKSKVNNGGTDRPRMSTSCSRCSVGRTVGTSYSMLALASTVIGIQAFRRRTRNRIKS